MKSFTLITISIIFLFTNSNAQTYQIPKTPLFNFLNHSDKPITDISNTQGQSFLPITLDKKSPDQKIIKNGKSLFILIDGTGQVYKAVEETNDQIAFTRLDSSYYSGYNFGAIDFSYRDTLFSLGGYGFWRTNGQLRYFKDGFEWNIARINKEYQLREFIKSYLPENSKLYYIQSPVLDEATSERPDQFLAIQLDLQKKKNRILGNISPEMGLQIKPYVTINLPSLQGTLVQTDKGTFLFRFIDNTVYKLVNSAIKDALYGVSTISPKNTFELNNKIYFSAYDNKIDSVSVSMNDFKMEPYPLYESGMPNLIWPYILIVGVLIIALITIVSIFRRKYKMQSLNSFDFADTILKKTNDLDFNQLEKNLINEIIIRSQRNEAFSVEDVNKVLGLSKKTIEIQKKIRTETINRINHKFKVNFSVETDLIERIRYEEDRRYFKYIISEQNVFLYTNKS